MFNEGIPLEIFPFDFDSALLLAFVPLVMIVYSI